MQKLKRELRNAADLAMSDYILSESCQNGEDTIILMIETLRKDLGVDQRQSLNRLLDYMNQIDSEFAYEAYYRGFMTGVAVMSEAELKSG